MKKNIFFHENNFVRDSLSKMKGTKTALPSGIRQRLKSCFLSSLIFLLAFDYFSSNILYILIENRGWNIVRFSFVIYAIADILQVINVPM